MRSARVFVQAAAALLALGLPGAALADEPDDPPAPRPTAPDTRTGHPTLALQLSLQRLMGSAENGRPHSSILGWGQAPGLQLAYPLHRNFAVEAWGSYASFGKDSACAGDCKGTSLAAGLGGVYHLVDGVPFDPWVSAGLGYRQTTLDIPNLGKFTYSGIEALRLAMGADYYLAPAIGVGPYVEFLAGRYTTRSPGPLGEGSGHTSLGFGLRVVLSPF